MIADATPAPATLASVAAEMGCHLMPGPAPATPAPSEGRARLLLARLEAGHSLWRRDDGDEGHCGKASGCAEGSDWSVIAGEEASGGYAQGRSATMALPISENASARVPSGLITLTSDLTVP